MRIPALPAYVCFVAPGHSLLFDDGIHGTPSLERLGLFGDYFCVLVLQIRCVYIRRMGESQTLRRLGSNFLAHYLGRLRDAFVLYSTHRGRRMTRRGGPPSGSFPRYSILRVRRFGPTFSPVAGN